LTIVAVNMALVCALYVVFNKNHDIYVFGERRISSNVDSPFYVDDPILGYRTSPGRRTITLKDGDKQISFTTETDASGYRLTSNPTQQLDEKPEIWIFGCSYTWGWLVNTEDTFPFLIQSAFPQYAVKNFGIPGYATVHSYLQLTTELAQRTAKYAVIAYASLHKRRNMAAASRMLECKNFELFGKLHHPKAFVDGNGRLQIRSVLIFAKDDDKDPSEAELNHVAATLLADMLVIFKEKGIIPLLAVLSREEHDPVVAAASAMGYDVLDINLDNAQSRYSFPGLDGHPNAAANKIYAAAILQRLAELEREQP